MNDGWLWEESEQILGRSLKTIGVKRSDVIIATKVAARWKPGRTIAARPRTYHGFGRGQPNHLGVDHIDFYQIHMSDPLTPEEETFRAFDDLVSQRLVRYVGCSQEVRRKIEM